MSLSRKTGEWAGKLVKSTTAAPEKTSSWSKKFAHEIAEGYRSVVPEKEEAKETNTQ